MKVFKVDKISDIEKSKKGLKIFSSFSEEKEKKVRQIVEDVKKNGDKAVLKYTKTFDWSGINSGNLKVKEKEIKQAQKKVNKDVMNALEKLAARIRNFEKRSLPKSWTEEKNSIVLGQKVIGLDSVGIYVPGGEASYPSSFVMCAVPAKMAGVKRIIVVSPPDKNGRINPYILALAKKMGIKDIYKVGGAQAIAALAYGTKIMPRADKIVGPGNAYVAMAKKLIFGQADIDFIAGPSEIAVLCDSQSRADLVASDILSQAEHAADALCLCVTDSEKFCKKLSIEIEEQKKKLSRKKILDLSLENCACVICKNMGLAIEFVNEIATEHLEIATKEPFKELKKIRNAAAIFLAEYSPVAIGDYMAGPSHVLPTAGSARFFSPLSVRDFSKTSNIIFCKKDGLKKIAAAAAKIARVEGFDGHANSIELRFKGRKK